MCFSSTASFTAAALLVPAGAIAVVSCRGSGRVAWLPLALSPALFGLQQALEGVVWLGLQGRVAAPLSQGAAAAYLFFAYAFWPAWIPWCALHWRRGAGGDAQPWLQSLMGAGLVLGGWLWLPLLLEPARLRPLELHGNLHYQTLSPLLTLIDLAQGSLLYGLLITLPLLLAGSARLRIFALALALAYGLAWFRYQHAFVSIWCFLSAGLALLVLWVVREPVGEKPAPAGGLAPGQAPWLHAD